MTATASGLHPEPARVSRRTFDRLHIARVLPGRWAFAVPHQGDAAIWPYLAFYSLAGQVAIDRPGHAVSLQSGELCVVRNSPGLAVRSSGDADLLVIRIPAGSVGPYAQALRAADGRTWSTHQGTASLVGHLLNGLAAQPEDYTSENPGRLAQHIVGLMALMCADGRLSADDSSRETMLFKAKEHIESRLGEIDLSPDRIAAAQNMSTRTLHRLFESEGLTISGWIRERRLEQCRIDLSDGSGENVPVSSIGTKWGLWDAAHFSRLFKAAYGLSPRAYRIAHRGHACGESCFASPRSLERKSA
ncbi:MAG TPA: helix-turn-helix domain-containing protein [Terrimesophilobacter sp.]|jgi:AraC-type DNA-binding domain-containing proteins|uniref:helix-turn-helix domain-containing protein n=1 Tax=Terrimesophilobacter sp. TaxID=2906435 RepID=UPI002F9456FB